MMDKVVVITGASSGIGAEVARLVGRQGGRPVLAARRDRELFEVTNQAGPMAMPVLADVTSRVAVRRILMAAIERYGRIDVWINNAGRGISRPVSQLSDDDIDEMMEVNVKSVLYGMQAVLPHFEARGTGHIINISSMLGRVPYYPMRSAYSAAKHAINSLTANLRMELKEKFPGIHVSIVFPGVVATDFGNHALGGGPDSRTLPNAQPVEEVAEIIAQLIEEPRDEVYTRPEMKQMVIDYYSGEKR